MSLKFEAEILKINLKVSGKIMQYHWKIYSKNLKIFEKTCVKKFQNYFSNF